MYASEETQNGHSGSWVSNQKDDKKRLRSLKRKFRSLEEENADLTEELIKARRLIKRLQNERSFILDRLIRLERLEGPSETETESSDSSSDSETETEDRKENGSPTIKLQKSSSFHTPVVNVDPEALGLCIAVVRDRPCKSKALSGYKYCWHHAPLDPNSPFVWCQYGGTDGKKKKCSIPVLKTKSVLFCKYHVKQGTEETETLPEESKAKKEKKHKKHKKHKKKEKKVKTEDKEEKGEEKKKEKNVITELGTTGAGLPKNSPEHESSLDGEDQDDMRLVITEESDSDGMTIAEEEELSV